MDVLIETDPEQAGKAYGLDSSNAITVEMWQIGRRGTADVIFDRK